MASEASVDWIAVLALLSGLAVIVPAMVALAWTLLAVAAAIF